MKAKKGQEVRNSQDDQNYMLQNVTLDNKDEDEETQDQSEQQPTEIKQFKPNTLFLVALIGMLLCHVLHSGYPINAGYRLYTFMRVRFNWSEGDVALYNSIYGQASLPGAALGSLICSKLLQKGRRLCLLLSIVFAALGMSFQIIENMWVIMIGRAIQGFAQGFMNASTGRVVEEYTPPHLFGLIMTLYMFLTQITFSISIILASLGMPGEKDIEGLQTTEYWRFFIGFPLIFCVISFLLLAFVIRKEPPKYLIALGKEDEAIESIKASYHQSVDSGEVLAFLKKTISRSTDTVTYKEALCDRKYRLTSYIMMICISFLAFNGVQVFAFYGQVILGKIFQGGTTGGFVTINNVLNMQLIVQPIAQFTSMLFVRSVPRRRLFMMYAFLVGSLNFLLAFFDVIDVNWAVVIVILFMFFIQDSMGVPVMGLYCIEVTNNSNLGVIQLYQNLSMFAIGLMVPFMVEGLSIPLLYCIFGGITLGSFVFIFFFIRETYNLTDKEKKSLYAPKDDEHHQDALLK